jgi:membrane protease YdiL (CAAX protease family)
VPIMLLGTLMYQGVSFVMIGVLLRLHNITWSEAFGFTRQRLVRTVGLATLASAIVLPIALALNWLSTLIMERMGYKANAQVTVQALQSTETHEQMIYFGIVTIILAPMVEELLFRGILYPTIKQFGFPKFAMWTVSIFFGFAHLNVSTFVPLVFLSVILIFLYETTENLLAPIITHALFNTANFFLLVWNKYHP